MKTFEILTLVGSFMFLVGIFCKAPKLFFESQSKSGFMKSVNLFGTVIVLFAPMLYITSVSLYVSLESSDPIMAERPLPQQWIFFTFLTLGFTLTYVMFLGMIRSVRNFFKSCSGTLEDLATILTMEAIKKPGSKKGGTDPKGFFYEAGKKFSEGMSDNFPGDEWKKGGEDDNEEPPSTNRFDRN